MTTIYFLWHMHQPWQLSSQMFHRTGQTTLQCKIMCQVPIWQNVSCLEGNSGVFLTSMHFTETFKLGQNFAARWYTVSTQMNFCWGDFCQERHFHQYFLCVCRMKKLQACLWPMWTNNVQHQCAPWQTLAYLWRLTAEGATCTLETPAHEVDRQFSDLQPQNLFKHINKDLQTAHVSSRLWTKVIGKQLSGPQLQNFSSRLMRTSRLVSSTDDGKKSCRQLSDPQPHFSAH